MGVANDHSIAWGIARALNRQGAGLAFTYQGEAFGKRVTGGRQIEFWTEADMVSIQNAASSVLYGQVLPAAPVGFSGYEMIYVVATVLSVVSFLLVRWMHADPVDPTQEQFEGSTWTDHGRAFKHLMKRSYDIGVGLLKEPTFRAYMLFISVLVLVRAIFVHAHSTWPTYMIREFGADVPQAALWSLNPLLIIFLTPVIGSLTSKFSSWNVIITGSFITAASVLFMVVPGPLEVVARGVLEPIAGGILDYRLAGPVLFIFVLSIGEALWSPRLYEYVAMMAPPGREASYMGLTQLPMFAAKPVVGLMSGWLLADFCPEVGARMTEILWTIVFATTLIGPLIALGFAGYIRSAEFARLDQTEAGVKTAASGA